MKEKIWNHAFLGAVFTIVVMSSLLASCRTTIEKTTEYSPQGNVTMTRKEVNKDVVNELRRVFRDTRLEGNGTFENNNEALARDTALNIAINDLAKQVQSKTRTESTIYNFTDVRTVIENQVNAIVQGYKIESQGYDPNSVKYRIRISIAGEQIEQEIERRIKK